MNHIQKVTFNYKGKQVDLDFEVPKKLDKSLWVMLGKPHSSGNYVWQGKTKKALLEMYTHFTSTNQT